MEKITVRRANVTLQVDEDQKDYYMERGYSVINSSGEVLEEAMPNDVGQLQLLVSELREELAKYKTSSKSTPTRGRQKKVTE